MQYFHNLFIYFLNFQPRINNSATFSFTYLVIHYYVTFTLLLLSLSLILPLSLSLLLLFSLLSLSLLLSFPPISSHNDFCFFCLGSTMKIMLFCLFCVIPLIYFLPSHQENGAPHFLYVKCSIFTIYMFIFSSIKWSYLAHF